MSDVVICHSLLRDRAVIGFEHGPLKADGVRIDINVRLRKVVIEGDITFYSDVAFIGFTGWCDPCAQNDTLGPWVARSYAVGEVELVWGILLGVTLPRLSLY